MKALQRQGLVVRLTCFLTLPILTLALSSPVSGQQVVIKATNGEPLKLSSFFVDNTTRAARGTYKNVSDKPIATFVVAEELLDSSGKVLFRASHTEIKSLTPEKAGMKPDSSAEIKLLLPFDKETGSIIPNTVNVSLDYVVFQDGSEWGPDTRRQREKIRAMREGAETQRTLGKSQQ
jgi:hypothetical protein